MESRKVLINRLKDELKRIKKLPCGPIYQRLNKYLAELYLEEEDERNAIYHIVESQAVSLRFRTIEKIEYLSAKSADNAASKDCLRTALDKKWLMLGNGMQDSSVENIVDNLKDLPPEWTVVQLTSGHDPLQIMGNPNKVRVPPCIHITRLDLYSGRPYSIKVPCTSRTVPQNGNYLEDFQNELDSMKQLTLTMQQENLTKYHMNKLAISVRLQTALNQIDMNWLKEWRCILIGQLVDEKLKRELEAGLGKIVSAIKHWKSSDKAHNFHLLWQALMASYSLSEFEMKKVVAYLTGLDLKSAECKKISEEICSLGVSVPKIKTAKRHPVILIVDDLLKRLPWENISVLKGHPVTRMHSLHFLRAMYEVYKHRINGGVVEGVDPSKGQYIVNPDKNLPGMEERIKSIASSRFPKWRGTFGVKPTVEQFSHALQDSDIFVYCGHGSGTQFLGSRQIQKLRVNAVALLFGCNSTGLTSFGARVETWSTAQCYMMSCSPCVVATLWNVTDVEIDKLATNLLHYWLPPTQEMKEIIESKQPKQLQKTATNRVLDDFDVIRRTNPSWRQEPNLLDAVNHGRAISTLFTTYASVVAIGLPIGLELKKT